MLPQVTIEIGFSSPSTGLALHLGDASRGILGVNTLATSDLFTDVTAWVRNWSTRRGATRADGPNLRFEAGTATIELNNGDRRFDPTNLDGPYVSGGLTQVEPMRAVRIRATWNGATYAVWRGFTDSWQVNYQGPSWSTTTVTCTDAFKVFASHDRDASAPVGGGETSGARINRILDSVAWPAADRIIDDGESTLQATTLADNTLAELQLTSDSELGEFYMDAAGHVVFRGRHARMEQARSNTSQATFGDDPDEPTELPYGDVTVAYDHDNLANLISVARAGGTAQVVEDAASRTRYLTHTYQRHDLLLESDTEALGYANFLLRQGARPELRFTDLQLKTPRPDVEDVLWPQMLGREIGDRITVIRRPPGGGDPIIRDVYLGGVEQTSDGESWTTKLVLQSAERLDFFVLGSPALGVLGTNALAY